MSDDAGIHWTSIDAPRGIPKRLRWIGWIVVLAVVAALIWFAFTESDKLVRGIATDLVKSSLTTALELEPGTPMTVDLGDDFLVFQAIGGSIDTVDVTVPNVVFGEATGTLALTVTGIPLDPSKPVAGLTARIKVDEANMLKFGGYLSAVPLTTVTMSNAFVTIGADVAAVPVTVSLAPSAAAGAVVFTPMAATAAGAVASIDELRAGPLAAAAAPLLTSRSLCVAQYLPKALTVTAASVVDKQLVVTATGSKVALTGGGLTTKGACAP